ncbi:MAG: hypothetical protein ABS939_06860 [Psychrobacillus sp.]
MWLGVIIGAVIVIFASTIGEIRVGIAKVEQDELRNTIAIKDEEIERLTANLNDSNAQIEEMKIQIKDMSKLIRNFTTGSKELMHSYTVVVKLLESEIGEEEANRRYREKINQEPEDLNNLMNELIKAKKESVTIE